MDSVEEAGSWILQILYDNHDSSKPISSESISRVVEMDESTVINGLNALVEAQLVKSTEKGYRLSEKGYIEMVQRATSYCPHL